MFSSVFCLFFFNLINSIKCFMQRFYYVKARTRAITNFIIKKISEWYNITTLLEILQGPLAGYISSCSHDNPKLESNGNGKIISTSYTFNSSPLQNLNLHTSLSKILQWFAISNKSILHQSRTKPGIPRAQGTKRGRITQPSDILALPALSIARCCRHQNSSMRRMWLLWQKEISPTSLKTINVCRRFFTRQHGKLQAPHWLQKWIVRHWLRCIRLWDNLRFIVKCISGKY